MCQGASSCRWPASPAAAQDDEREREGKPVLSMGCHAAAGTAWSDHAAAPSGRGLVEQLGHDDAAPLDHLDLVRGTVVGVKSWGLGQG